jgi:hypothetical protein
VYLGGSRGKLPRRRRDFLVSKVAANPLENGPKLEYTEPVVNPNFGIIAFDSRGNFAVEAGLQSPWDVCRLFTCALRPSLSADGRDRAAEDAEALASGSTDR